MTAVQDDLTRPTEAGWDLLTYADDLNETERQALLRLRLFMEEHVRPIANDFWDRAEFPVHLVPELAQTGAFGFGYPGIEKLDTSALFRGLATLELARVDPGFATMRGVSSGLAMKSIALLGSDEQRNYWLPRLGSGESIGAFALTEPFAGSDVARGLSTTCRREGETWILNGAKRWIGNATWGDVVIIWARDDADGQVKGFIVRTNTPGYTARKIERKYSQRNVQNADITLEDVVVLDADRLPEARTFADTARVLTASRLDVAWTSLGTAIGAYEAALAYANSRTQFGKPIARFQLVQDLLVRSVSNITASVAVCARVAVLADRHGPQDHQTALAKAFVTTRTREVVAWCREIFGGNGVDLDFDVIRFFADAEALYSYEGTREVNTLIVGRHITGESAFV
jgi:glutaryl-CoA dehydrogenase